MNFEFNWLSGLRGKVVDGPRMAGDERGSQWYTISSPISLGSGDLNIQRQK